MLTVKKIIRQAKKDAQPDSVFVGRLWQRLESEFPPLTTRDRLGLLFRRSAMVAMIVIPCCFLTTGVYAYASSSVTQESALYPMKQRLEYVEERFLARTPDSRAAFHVKMYERRLAETEHLLRRNAMIRATFDEATTEGGMADVLLEEDGIAPENRQKNREHWRNLQSRYETVRLRVYKEDGAQ